MYPPKARRITPFVTIPTGMARLFLEFFRTETACPDTSTPNRTNLLGFAIRWQGPSTLCMPLAAPEQTFKIWRPGQHDGVPNEGLWLHLSFALAGLMPKLFFDFLQNLS